MPSNDYSECPYPGLRPFLPEDSGFFFGRDEQIEELLARLETHRFVAVVGTSGCGKSSLVYAGLLPVIQEGYLSDAGLDWRIARMRPGNAPISRLAAGLADIGLGLQPDNTDKTAAFLEATLRRGPLGLVEVVRESRLPADANLLLVVDQFEELFRYRGQSQNVDDADAFVNLLLAATRSAQAEELASSGATIYVVLTMRSDFIGDCALFPKLPEAINESQFLTPRLTRDQYRAAITEPAKSIGSELEPALVNRLLNDLRGEPSQLPLLQHALMRMWTKAAAEPHWTGKLKLDDYENSKIANALSDHCEEIYEELKNKNEANPKITEVLFRCLCERSSNARDVRRPVPLGEIAAVAGVKPDQVKPVVEAFRGTKRSFLMPPRNVELNDTTVIDISHEAIIPHWLRLNNWVARESESAAIYRRLESASQRHSQGEGELWRRTDRKTASEWLGSEPRPNAKWAERYGGDFQRAASFLKQSRNVEVARKLVVATAIVSFSIFGYYMWTVADTQKFIAQDRLAHIFLAHSEKVSRRDLDLKRLLAVEALRADESFATTNWLRNVWIDANRNKHVLVQKFRGSPVRDVQIGVDGSVVIVRNDDVVVWIDKEKNEHEFKLPPTHLPLSAAVSHDQRILVVGDDKGNVWLWNSLSGGNANAFQFATYEEGAPADDRGVLELAFRPGDAFLATSDEQGGLKLWSIPQDRDLPALHNVLPNERLIRSVDFSQDGKQLAGGTTSGQILIWDLTETGGDATSVGHYDTNISIISLAFHPVQHVIATGASELRLWKLDDPNAAPTTLYSENGQIMALAYNQDGDSLTIGTGNHLKIIPNLNLDSDELVKKVCQSVGRNLTLKETRDYIKENIYMLSHKTCDSLDIHETFAEYGSELAKQNSSEELISFYVKLNDLQGEHKFHPKEEAYFRRGLYKASQDDVEEAVAFFERAAEVGREFPMGPTQTARRVAACALREKGVQAATRGKIDDGAEHFEDSRKRGWTGEDEQCDDPLDDHDSRGNNEPDFDPRQMARSIAQDRIRKLLEKQTADNLTEAADILINAENELEVDDILEVLDAGLQGEFMQQAAIGRTTKASELLDKAKTLDINLNFSDEQLSRLVKGLERNGERLAVRQKPGEANIAFALAAELLDVTSDPERGDRLAALAQAKVYAKNNDVEKAVEEFRKAQKYGAEINPESEAWTLIGEAFAGAAKLDEAVGAFEKAQSYGAELKAAPEILAKKIVVRQLFRNTFLLAKRNKIDEAIEAYSRADALGVDIDKVSIYWNGLCWNGALSDDYSRKEIMEACQRAINEEPGNVGYRDSRGVLLARLGGKENLQTAVRDFEAYVEASTAVKEAVDMRREWIKEINDGNRPITAEVITKLAKGFRVINKNAIF